jgi:hypothetical protein
MVCLLYLMAAPYRLVFRAIALTLRAGLHSQPLIYDSEVVWFRNSGYNNSLLSGSIEHPPPRQGMNGSKVEDAQR